jgi:prepilin-type N-terminal cleavage/methylation domain-containing protein
MSRRAFTLVELLVVIAIIGLLSTIGIVAMTSARMQSRNTRRLADMKQLLTAFQLGLDAKGSYPAATGCLSAGSACLYGWSGQLDNATVDAFISPYIATKPVYPIPSPAVAIAGYLYTGGWGGGTSPYSGIYYSAQPLLDWVMEGSTSCGFGTIWAQYPSYTECIFFIKNT